MRTVFLCSLFFSLILNSCVAPVQYKAVYTISPYIRNENAPIINIYIDRSFSQNEKLAIDNGINNWNYVLNGQMILKVVDYNVLPSPENIQAIKSSGNIIIIQANETDPNIPKQVNNNDCQKKNNCLITLAWADSVGGNLIYIIKRRVMADNVEYIVMHELGHVFHLSHQEDENSLMYRIYTKLGYLCVDFLSAKLVAEQYNLDVNRINYCASKY